MAQPVARDAQDFARLMLRTVERIGQGGEWIPAREAYERTAAEHPDHPYLAHVVAKPGRRIGLSATLERLRQAEFPGIERRKSGARRNAPVLYRVGTAPVALDLQLPQDAPASHPLVTRRRVAEVLSERSTSARRAVALAAPAAATCAPRFAGHRERPARAAPLVAMGAATARDRSVAGRRACRARAAQRVAAAAGARPDSGCRPDPTLDTASRGPLEPPSDCQWRSCDRSSGMRDRALTGAAARHHRIGLRDRVAAAHGRTAAGTR